MAILMRNLSFLNHSYITTRHSGILGLCSLRYAKCNPIYRASSIDNRILPNLQKAQKASTILNESGSNGFASKEYRMFYKLPHVKSASLVNKLKKIYTYVVIAGTPIIMVLWAANIISGGTMSAFFALGGLMCVSLYTLGIAFYKLIGFVYLSTDSNIVKVSYLDFWGRRVNSYCSVEDIIPLCDMQENASDLYIKFSKYSSPQVLYLTLRFGHITDKELFLKVFGKTD